MSKTKAYSVSAIIVIISIVIMTISSELSESFKSILTNLTGHHWITKSIFSILLFFILSFVFKGKNDNKTDIELEIKSVFWTSIIGAIVILTFFIFETLK